MAFLSKRPQPNARQAPRGRWRIGLGHLVLVGALLSLNAAPVQAEEDWRALNGAELAALLSEGRWVYEDGAWQEFRPSGRTLYTSAEPSWGRWQAQNDRYCSQWPPSDAWDCYDVERDAGFAPGDRVRFVDDWGNATVGTRIAPEG
ncbi:MAG: hypothetical protein AAFN09_03875 [Pseudomonadota bacterium]